MISAAEDKVFWHIMLWGIIYKAREVIILFSYVFRKDSNWIAVHTPRHFTTGRYW